MRIVASPKEDDGLRHLFVEKHVSDDIGRFLPINALSFAACIDAACL
jgi:hypothetical protein